MAEKAASVSVVNCVSVLLLLYLVRVFIVVIM